jgi:hypothetical protein
MTAPTYPPICLDSIKDDLGIEADDTTNDAWLNRRIAELWSRIESYTDRTLALEGPWVDDWGDLVTNRPAHVVPYPIDYRRGSVYLNVFPVAAVTKLTLNGAVADASNVLFDRKTGKLLSLSGVPTSDLGHLVVSGNARLEYTAGFKTLPPVLYGVVRGALEIQWSARQAKQSGSAVGGYLPTRISAIDVGEVELTLAPNPIVEATMKGVGTSDPLLGPYTEALDPFVDYRGMATGPLPTSEPLPPPPGP